MGSAIDARLALKAELCQRISYLAHELPHLSQSHLAFAVDDIRRIACNNGLDPLADIARALEKAVATSNGATMVLPFLEAMSDAVDCDGIDPAIAQSFLASVGLRLHG